jgi:ABC-type multidrug transport system fused ATPase/permease subunit
VFSNFVSATWFLFEVFIFVAYIMVMFHIIVDLFRDPDLGGGAKALWIVALIFLPIITALVYLVARGRGMADRQRTFVQRAREQKEEYIREVAGTSPAEQIARAKALLTEGTITQGEFDRLKAKALA